MVEVDDVLAVYPQKLPLFQYILSIFQRFENDVLLFVQQYQFGLVVTGFCKNDVIHFYKRYPILAGYYNFENGRTFYFTVQCF